MGILKSIGTIILWIIGAIVLVILGLFAWYKIQSKDDNLGFQDFVIDRLANKEPKTQDVSPVVAPVVETKEEKIAEIDPLKTYTPPTTEIKENNETIETSAPTDAVVPDWLKPTTDTNPSDPLASPQVTNTPIDPAPQESTTGGLPSWLAPASTTEAIDPLSPSDANISTENSVSENISENNFTEASSENSAVNNSA